MKTVAAMIEKLPTGKIQDLIAGCVVTLEEGMEITKADVVIQRAPKAGMVVASESDVIVALDTALTPDLIQEGLAREFVSRVQNLRKDADFEVTQRIAVAVTCDAQIQAAIERYGDYVKAETLCESLIFAQVSAEAADLNGHAVAVVVDKMRRQ
jgi:isoleucyl-tRNA synthetase